MTFVAGWITAISVLVIAVVMTVGMAAAVVIVRKSINRLIEAANLRWTAHTWSSALNSAASVQLLATSPKHGWTMDFKPHESPMQHELVSDPWVARDGFIAVRTTPGLGVTVREEVVKKYEFC